MTGKYFFVLWHHMLVEAASKGLKGESLVWDWKFEAQDGRQMHIPQAPKQCILPTLS